MVSIHFTYCQLDSKESSKNTNPDNQPKPPSHQVCLMLLGTVLVNVLDVIYTSPRPYIQLRSVITTGPFLRFLKT